MFLTPPKIVLYTYGVDNSQIPIPENGMPFSIVLLNDGLDGLTAAPGSDELAGEIFLVWG